MLMPSSTRRNSSCVNERLLFERLWLRATQRPPPGRFRRCCHCCMPAVHFCILPQQHHIDPSVVNNRTDKLLRSVVR